MSDIQEMALLMAFDVIKKMIESTGFPAEEELASHRERACENAAAVARAQAMDEVVCQQIARLAGALYDIFVGTPNEIGLLKSARILKVALKALEWYYRQVGTERFMGELKAVAAEFGIEDQEMFELFKLIAAGM